jgi:hypothetical protein
MQITISVHGALGHQRDISCVVDSTGCVKAPALELARRWATERGRTPEAWVVETFEHRLYEALVRAIYDTGTSCRHRYATIAERLGVSVQCVERAYKYRAHLLRNARDAGNDLRPSPDVGQ